MNPPTQSQTNSWGHPQASFICAPVDTAPAAPYFRREFTVEHGMISATLSVTALGIVEPYLNGSRIGDAVLAPGWTSYRHRIIVTTRDVTADLRPGRNVVGAIVGDGWAVGRLGWEGARRLYADRPALFLTLELNYPEHIDTIVSDNGFRVSTGAVLANSIYDGETYDARREPHGWSAPGFDDCDWQPAEPYDYDLSALTSPVGPPIRPIEELPPKAIHTSPSGKTIVDFGQNIAGWVQLTVTGQSGDEITIRHAEILTPAGELETETNRTAQATDRYVLAGNGPETWAPRFTFHGFRYAEITGWPTEFSTDSVRAVAVHSDMTRTGWFETSNDLLNRLHSNVVWSMRGNFVGVPTDCPQRDERLGWTGDINAFAPTATYLYDAGGVLRSWLQDLAAEQSEKGDVPWTVPDILGQSSSPVALWSDVAVNLPWHLYQEYGDLDILRQCYASMTTYVRQVEALLDESGLWSSGFQFGDWLDPDAPASNPTASKTDRHLVASAYLCRTTAQMRDTAKLLGEAKDAAAFAALATRVRRAFRHEYVTGSGRLVNETATAYALAIVFDLLDPGQRETAGRRLAEVVAQRGYRINTGFAGTPLVTEALSSTGHLDTAYRLLLETESPSFLYPVTMGATTIWERWDSVLPDGTVNATGMTSLNHYALGAVADWLHRIVGGLQRSAPGYRRVRIAPQPGGGLTSARTAHDTANGRIEVAWRIERGQVRLDVSIPSGTEADVVLPLHPGPAHHTVAAGKHSWRYPTPAAYGAPPAITMDTPIRELAHHDELWQAVSGILEAHFPGIPLDAAAPEAAGLTLNGILELVPATSTDLAASLDDTINRFN